MALRLIATVYKALGFVLGIATAILTVVGFFIWGPLAVLVLPGGAVATITCFAFASSIEVVLAMEENTRLTVQVLHFMANAKQG